MRYLFFLLPLALSGCLNIPFIPLVNNDTSQYQKHSIVNVIDDRKVINN